MSNNNLIWATIFASIMWHVWKMQNELQFNNKAQNENFVVTTSLNFAREISNAFETNSQSNLNQDED